MKLYDIITESEIKFVEVKLLNSLSKMDVDSSDFEEIFNVLVQNFQFNPKKYTDQEIINRIIILYYEYYDQLDGNFKTLVGVDFDEDEYFEDNDLVNDEMKALGENQGVSPLLITYEDNEIYRVNTTDEKYLVLTDEEADKRARASIINYFDEAESLPDSYLDVSESAVEEWVEGDANSYVYEGMSLAEQIEQADLTEEHEDLTEQLSDIEDEIEELEDDISLIEDDIDITKQSIEDEYGNIELIKKGEGPSNITVKEIEDGIIDLEDDLKSYIKDKAGYEEKLKEFKERLPNIQARIDEIERDAPDEAYEKYKDMLNGNIEHMGVREYFKSHFGYSESQLVELGILKLDLEYAVNQELQSRGQWLSHYDHNEDYETVDDTTYYIYRYE
jgi:predicted  nucleic acid-binding Zn-ribbon protein